MLIFFNCKIESHRNNAFSLMLQRGHLLSRDFLFSIEKDWSNWFWWSEIPNTKNRCTYSPTVSTGPSHKLLQFRGIIWLSRPCTSRSRGNDNVNGSCKSVFPTTQGAPNCRKTTIVARVRATLENKWPRIHHITLRMMTWIHKWNEIRKHVMVLWTLHSALPYLYQELGRL